MSEMRILELFYTRVTLFLEFKSPQLAGSEAHPEGEIRDQSKSQMYKELNFQAVIKSAASAPSRNPRGA